MPNHIPQIRDRLLKNHENIKEEGRHQGRYASAHGFLFRAPLARGASWASSPPWCLPSLSPLNWLDVFFV
ncbi:hypothetical protein Vsou_07250 [Vulcanisaeta souniana JCM 11219]|uniref:Uncharacterized protein n=1 Tax=Vulcanisaeta souniana JCM 11219 TaxID=1293586 RepID=A0ABM8BKY8_9CREN|nr:hypothetical protein Vsou_07250 [Vulcanisaeta souniana JCM 11219]